MGGQYHTPVTLPLGKRLDGPQDQSGWVQKINLHQDWTIQPIASCYTDSLSEPPHVLCVCVCVCVCVYIYIYIYIYIYVCVNIAGWTHTSVDAVQ